tara:strand:- start:4075 stop:4305 length:231 start_codon:yes stop_codon:yes gene_type:complete
MRLSSWQKETRPTFGTTPKKFQGTAEYQRKKGNWLLRVTNTQTKRVVEKRCVIAKESDTAIWKAKELAREWEKGNG